MQINLNPAELTAISLQIVEAVTALHESFAKRREAQQRAADNLDCLTVADVAKRLKCDAKTVRKYIAEGKLKAANFGDMQRPQYRTSEADLRAFYAAHRNGR